MNRRGFLRAVAALTGAAVIPATVAAPKTVFGLESLGFTEIITWHDEYKAWLVLLQKKEGDRVWEYARLIEDDPCTLPESILDFYRDDAVAAFKHTPRS